LRGMLRATQAQWGRIAGLLRRAAAQSAQNRTPFGLWTLNVNTNHYPQLLSENGLKGTILNRSKFSGLIANKL